MTRRCAPFLVGILAAATACPGCGLLLNGRSQRITITSSPPGATIIVPTDGGTDGASPHTLRLARNRDHLIIAEKTGFETKSAYISSGIEPLSIALDILLTGGLGLLLDWPLGAIYRLEPNQIHIALPEKTE